MWDRFSCNRQRLNTHLYICAPFYPEKFTTDKIGMCAHVCWPSHLMRNVWFCYLLADFAVFFIFLSDSSTILSTSEFFLSTYSVKKRHGKSVPLSDNFVYAWQNFPTRRKLNTLWRVSSFVKSKLFCFCNSAWHPSGHLIHTIQIFNCPFESSRYFLHTVV